MIIRGLVWRKAMASPETLTASDLLTCGTRHHHLITYSALTFHVTRLVQQPLKLRSASSTSLARRVGVMPDNDKIKIVEEWPTPCNAKEVQQFLGQASYYRRFVTNLQTLQHLCIA
ncbi:hypothetical protein EMCRGX_G034368 [Ephydatia muelleri]